MNIKGVRVNLWSQGMKELFSPLRVRKSYSGNHMPRFFIYVFTGSMHVYLLVSTYVVCERLL